MRVNERLTNVARMSDNESANNESAMAEFFCLDRNS